MRDLGKGSAEQILADRLAVKIGMIIRRATKVAVILSPVFSPSRPSGDGSGEKAAALTGKGWEWMGLKAGNSTPSSYARQVSMAMPSCPGSVVVL